MSFTKEKVNIYWHMKHLFPITSKYILKAVLVHFTACFSFSLFEENLQVINYSTHDWMICGASKVICMILGQKLDTWCIYEWDSKEREKNNFQ